MQYECINIFFQAGSTTWVKIFYLLSKERSESRSLRLPSSKLHGEILKNLRLEKGNRTSIRFEKYLNLKDIYLQIIKPKPDPNVLSQQGIELKSHGPSYSLLGNPPITFFMVSKAHSLYRLQV